MTSGTMLRTLLSGLAIAMATSQQSDATFTPLPNPSPRCCDGTTAECQALIRQCFANTNSTATGTAGTMSCYSIACPTPMPVPSSPISPPSSQCCDPATLPCQDAIKACIGVGNTQSFCYQSLVCPTPSPLSRSPFPTVFPPSPIQCCDPTRTQCTADQVICPSVTQTLKPQQSPSASFTIRPSPPIDTFVPSASVTIRPPPQPSPMETFTPFPTKRPLDQPTPTPAPCCDPSTQSCQTTIKECLAQNVPPAVCQALACTNTTLPQFSPFPSAPCCDPVKPECMETVKRCFDSGNPPSMCQALMCPTPIPSIPSDMPQCCDPAKPECLFAIRQCITQGGSDLLCNMLACPSITPPPIKPSVSALPSRRPPFPSRSAQPTMIIKPLFSALPTRPPARSRLPINFTLPDRLPATISFPRANVTELIRPAKLQEIQASIACAVRMPLENIEIKNITIRRALTGLEEPVVADLSVARLNSNGSVQCLVIREQPRLRLRQVRRLQTTEDSVNVQYDIVAPTEDAMTTDLGSVLSGDATMNALATSVGGTSVVATTGGQQQQQPQPQQPSSPTTSSSSVNMIGGIVGAIGGVIAIAVAGAMIVQSQRNRNRNRTVSATTRSSHSSSVIVVTQENPITHPANASQSQRVVFTPYGARV